MLKEILAISGKPGLFKIVAHNGKSLIVEDLVSGKRFPVSARDRVMSLGDIAMYAETEDKPLGEILDSIYVKENGEKIDIREIISNPGLKVQFEKYLPDFDRERVHDSDIKKLFTWYNLLVDKGFTKFTEEEKTEETNSEEDKTTADQSTAESGKAEDKKKEDK